MKTNVVIAICCTFAIVGIAQEKGSSAASLKDTITWMANFTREHGSMTYKNTLWTTNVLTEIDGCKVYIEHRFLKSTRPSDIKVRTEAVSLGAFDPERVTLKREHYSDESDDTFRVEFEMSDAAAKMEVALENFDGKKRTSYVADEYLAMDSAESASRLKKALAHAITLCGGAPAPF